MAGTSEGGLKAAKKRAKRSHEFYVEIGAKGGSAPHSSRPFQLDRKLAIRAGKIGGMSKTKAGRKKISNALKKYHKDLRAQTSNI
jgi:general stress protein YciG